ncbi:MAG: hypothetical protein H6741_30300 [Alphaproteobacteria bacterium]|nr:hypothetical protein [Alphaproteobacteria bacterium]
MAERRRGPNDLPLNWRGGRHRPFSDPTVTSVSVTPGVAGGGEPKKRRHAGPSLLEQPAEGEGPKVNLEQLEPARPTKPRASGRIKLPR